MIVRKSSRPCQCDRFADGLTPSISFLPTDLATCLRVHAVALGKAPGPARARGLGSRVSVQCGRQPGTRTMRASWNLLSKFNLIWVVQSPSQKHFASPSPQISGYSRAVSSRQEGRIAIVTNARRDAVDASASARQVCSRGGSAVSEQHRAGRTALVAYGKTVWSRHPLLVPSCRWLMRSNRIDQPSSRQRR